MMRILIRSLIPFIVYAYACSNKENTSTQDWSQYLGGSDRNHYSALFQIDTSNVGTIEKAWEYHTGDSGQMQCNPLIIDGVLYGLTASNFLFALDAAIGRQLWRFEPDSVGSKNVNRGVSYWEDGRSKRILYAYESWLYAVDARTGRPIKSFGNGGRVSLKAGLGAEHQDKFVVSTTPGTVYKDIIIMPIRVGEGSGAAPGYIQAFNVRTGRIAWVFKTIPHPGERGYDTWPENAHRNLSLGGANNWAGMAIDHRRGLVYIPTGSASFDFYGGNRKGSNLFANCVLALEAESGAYRWHFQVVHHDLWDRDLPAPPNLVTIKKDGEFIDAVAQVTKSGHVFVLNRETGESLFPIDELPVPASTIPGEETWSTQPIPRLPAPFARQSIIESEITHFSDRRDSLIAIFRSANKGMFHPLDFNQTLLFPGADGGAEWGGAAVDSKGVMYVNSNEMPWLFSLSPKSGQQNIRSSTGKALYTTHCATCHKQDLSGSPNSGYPTLLNLNQRIKRDDALSIISKGKGMMPGFPQLSQQERQSITAYVFGEAKEEALDVEDTSKRGIDTDVPYVFNGYNKFLDEHGYPAITPPWGTLTAIDLNNGDHLWQIPLGESKELSGRGIPITGTENYGGPIVTEGGVLFIAATPDKTFKAFNSKDGALLWKYPLTAAGFATPSTYMAGGKQYIVIACGGTKIGAEKGDSYIAFRLPD